MDSLNNIRTIICHAKIILSGPNFWQHLTNENYDEGNDDNFDKHVNIDRQEQVDGSNMQNRRKKEIGQYDDTDIENAPGDQ